MKSKTDFRVINYDSVVDVIIDKNFTDLDHIHRFNGMPVFFKESVSQHQFWAATFCSILCQEMFNDIFKDWGEGCLYAYKFSYEAVTSCIFHDWEETITGDVLYMLKHNEHNGKDLRDLIDEYSDIQIDKLNLKQTATGSALFNLIDRTIVTDKLIKYFTKICDWLACLKYAYCESYCGNSRMAEVVLESCLQLDKVIEKFLEEATYSKYKLDLTPFQNIKDDLWKMR